MLPPLDGLGLFSADRGEKRWNAVSQERVTYYTSQISSERDEGDDGRELALTIVVCPTCAITVRAGIPYLLCV